MGFVLSKMSPMIKTDSGNIGSISAKENKSDISQRDILSLPISKPGAEDEVGKHSLSSSTRETMDDSDGKDFPSCPPVVAICDLDDLKEETSAAVDGEKDATLELPVEGGEQRNNGRSDDKSNTSIDQKPGMNGRHNAAAAAGSISSEPSTNEIGRAHV